MRGEECTDVDEGDAWQLCLGRSAERQRFFRSSTVVCPSRPSPAHDACTVLIAKPPNHHSTVSCRALPWLPSHRQRLQGHHFLLQLWGSLLGLLQSHQHQSLSL